MVEMNSDVKTMGIPINMQRVFNPLVEAATLRMQDSQIGNFNVAIEDLNETSGSSDNDSYVTKEFEVLYRHSVTLTAVYCVAYVIVFIVGLIGNSFVIAVVLRSPRMRTVTNFFIVNLAVADILVIVFCLPATLMSNIFVPWILGNIMCKVVPYIQGVSVAASVYSLCAVSIDSHIVHSAPVHKVIHTPVVPAVTVVKAAPIVHTPIVHAVHTPVVHATPIHAVHAVNAAPVLVHH